MANSSALSRYKKLITIFRRKSQILMAIFSFLLKCLCFIIATISGYCIIALFLNELESINEKWYQSLTYWANQKPAPKIKSCSLKKLPNSPYPSDSKYEYYQFSIYADVKSQIGSALVFPNIEYMLIINNANENILYYQKETLLYKMLLWRKKLSSQWPQVIVRTEKEYLQYPATHEFNEYDCPLRVEIFYDE